MMHMVPRRTAARHTAARGAAAVGALTFLGILAAPAAWAAQDPPQGDGVQIVLDSGASSASVDPLGDVTGTNLQPLDEGSYTQPEFGAVELSPDGGLTYTPQEGWSGATSFTVDVCDDQDQCALLVYDVLVRPSDDPVGDATGTAGELAETGPIAWRWPTALAALMTAVGAGLVAASRVAGTHRRRAN